MTPQIIGTKKSSAYRACVRYCKERGIAFQERDPVEAPLTPGELEKIATACGGHEELVDASSKLYRERGLEWMDYDAREELLQYPRLLRGPIVRTDRGIAVDPDQSRLGSLLS